MIVFFTLPTHLLFLPSFGLLPLILRIRRLLLALPGPRTVNLAPMVRLRQQLLGCRLPLEPIAAYLSPSTCTPPTTVVSTAVTRAIKGLSRHSIGLSRQHAYPAGSVNNPSDVPASVLLCRDSPSYASPVPTVSARCSTDVPLDPLPGMDAPVRTLGNFLFFFVRQHLVHVRSSS